MGVVKEERTTTGIKKCTIFCTCSLKCNVILENIKEDSRLIIQTQSHLPLM